MGLDEAVLDLKFRSERAYPIAGALRACSVPSIFARGYDAWVIPEAYADVPRCEKPCGVAVITRLVAGRIGQ